MFVERLELVDFRNYKAATFRLAPGSNVVVGDNGQGKTSFAEALAYLANLSSFRAVGNDALVRIGASSALVRATLRDDDRESLIEAELLSGGRGRVQINRQRLERTRDLLGVLRVTVFSPDDLTLVKGGPADRRAFMDDALVALAVKYDALRLELERILKQRNMLLRQVSARGSALAGDDRTTLDVWDAKFTETGEQFGRARAALVDQAGPYVTKAYSELADGSASVTMSYDAAWRGGGLGAALLAARPEDLRRGITTVGPHRDDLQLGIATMPARTHASQGEQRTLALALRLGVHHLVAERTGTTPVLVLDDVLSELDANRVSALLRSLPRGQVVITTAGSVPDTPGRYRLIQVDGGAVVKTVDGP